MVASGIGSSILIRLFSDLSQDILFVLDVLDVLGSTYTLFLDLLESKKFTCLLDPHQSDLAKATPANHTELVKVIQTVLLFLILFALFLLARS